MAAGTSSRRSGPPPVSAQPSRAALLLRRIGTAIAGLAIVTLAGAACALSFDAIRALALAGGARHDLAYLYPAGFDALLVIALIAVFLLRSARLLARLQAWLVLAVLIVAAGAANVVGATQTTLDTRALAVGAAVTPWLMLLIGLWLFLLPAGAQQTRPGPDTAEGRGQDIVPFGREERDPGQAPPLDAAVHAIAPSGEIVPHLGSPDDVEPDVTRVVPPTPAPETPTVDELPPLREQGRRPSADGEDAARPAPPTTPSVTSGSSGRSGAGFAAATADAPAAQAESDAAVPSPAGVQDVQDAHPAAAVAQESAPLAPEAGAVPEEAPAAESAATAPEKVADMGTVSGAHAHGGPEAEHNVPAPEPEQRLVPRPRGQAVPERRQERDPDRPLRWGDLVRPATGDVLVHPLPAKPERGREMGDTQPYPNITGHEPEPPADAAPEKDSAPEKDEEKADTQPYPHLRGEAAPLPQADAREAEDAAWQGGAVPDPAHQAGSAEEHETSWRRAPSGEAETAPGEGGPAAPPPSGRMRSTPLPPEE
ncbi:hypothetical protein Sme01_57940 [Sphaerisporangium melleum]|uniref:DUF2637 domain-containing protein n=1 Tax=Sphaerisporangium melleum TaxID=321316 RepID=A0A917VM50_9ACTN|nr:hypothetical protein GCM10007964_41820 [Sphaerisporangium melleum]GII73318.1 hypothetical protein Sme01_57940 [Sphaerisporangium melleum]